MRKHHRSAKRGARYPFITARILFLIVVFPVLITFYGELKGANVHQAIERVLRIFTSPESIRFFWVYIAFSAAIILFYLKPIIALYCEQCHTSHASERDAKLAVKRFNKLHLFIIAITTLGFLVAESRALMSEGRTGGPEFIARHIVFLKALSNGLLCGTLISFSLENALFRAKRAAIEISPKTRLHKTSLFNRIALVITVLLLFMIAQFFSFASETFARVDESGNIVLSGSAIADYFSPDNDQDKDADEDGDDGQGFSIVRKVDGTGPGGTVNFSFKLDRGPKMNEILSVLDLKIAIFCLIALMLLLQIKRMIRSPLAEMADRLETINSGNISEITAIDVINNDEFAQVLREVNTLIAKQQSELECSSHRLEEIVSRAADAIIAFTRSGAIEVFNPAAERFFGYSAEETKTMSLLDLIEIPAEFEGKCTECEPTEALIDYLYAGDLGIKRFTGIRKDGVRVPFESNVSMETSEGSAIYTTIIRDIAKQVAIEETLREASVSAENANRLKTEFLANMSHELRTPLNAVLGFTQLMSSDKNLTPGQLEKIQIISRSGEHLLSLINDILDISKIEAGKSELHRSVFSPERFVEDLREMFELRCKKAGLGLYVEYSGVLPARVTGDLGKLRQVMINLVGNAVKFTSEGGIGILAGMDGDRIRFAVTDSGKGIPKDELKAIMEPFIQSSVTDNEGGTGLGLAISSRYIRMMGGELEVESELGRGSTFSFAIELPETDEALPDSGTEPVAVAVKKGCEVTALVVDDKELNRLVLKEMLETAGFTAIEAENGKVAVERAKEFSPDIVFMDIKMPVMDGYAAVKALKENAETRNIPVFALTASAFTNDEDRILASGFDGFLAKPFKRADLFALIRDKSQVELEYETGETAQPEKAPDSAHVDFARAALALGKEGRAELSGYALINDFTAIKALARRIEDKAPDFARLIAYHATSFNESAFDGILKSLDGTVKG
jgi:PAS domain S-box-containing protein